MIVLSSECVGEQLRGAAFLSSYYCKTDGVNFYPDTDVNH